MTTHQLPQVLTGVSMQDYIRSPTLEITPPPGTQEPLALHTIDSAFERIADLRGIELLWYHDTCQRLLVTPQVTTQVNNQLTLTNSISSPDTARVRVANQVGQLLLDQLPPEYTVAIGDVNMRPIGITPTWTVRILLGENNDLTDKAYVDWHPLLDTIAQLVDNNIPYLVQTLIHDRDKRLVTVRIAVFLSGKPASSDQFFYQLYEGAPIDIISNWTRAGFKTSMDLRIEDYYRVIYDDFEKSVPNYSRRSRCADIRALYTGTAEYSELLRGRLATPPGYRYGKRDLYGKISATPGQLELFAALQPDDRSVNWQQAPGRGPPLVNKRMTLPVDSSSDADIDTYKKEIPQTKVQTAGNDGHDASLQRFIKKLSEYGYDAWMIDQDTSSVADGALSHGEVPPAKLDAVPTSSTRLYTVELESKTKSKPSRILQNKERAAWWGVPTVVAARGDEDASAFVGAESVADILTAPYRDKLDGIGVRTYNMDDNIELQNGGTVLLPEGVTETCWHLTTDGRLKLMGDGEVLADAPADADLATIEYQTPTYHVEGDDHYILDPAGGSINRGNSSAILDGFVKASLPHVPYHHHYIFGTTLVDPTGQPVTEIPLPLRDPAALSDDTEGYKRVLSRYLDAALVRKEGAEVYRGQIKHEVMSLIAQLTPTFGETEWPDVGQPADNWWGRIWPGNPSSAAELSDDIDVMPKETEYHNGDRVKMIKDYTFIYPSGLISPHTSCVDNHRRSVLTDQRSQQ